MTYNSLKNRWIKKLTPDAFAFKENSYWIRFSQYGSSGACGSGVLLTESFDNAKDLLGYLRFVAIPFILDYDSGVCSEGTFKQAEHYLPKYSGDKKKSIQQLLSLLDKNIRGAALTPAQMNKIILKYNQTFSNTNPESEIPAHGRPADFLSSKYILEEMKEKLADADSPEAAKKVIKLAKDKKINFKDETHADVLFSLLESMDQV